MKVLFLCCTPYHLFNAINLTKQLHKKDEVDLFIFEHFNNAQLYANKIKASSIFSQIKCIKDRPEQRIRILKYSFSKSILFDTLKYYNQVEVKEYDHIYTSHKWEFFKVYLHKVYKKNKKVRVSYVEDGVETYVTQLDFQLSKIDKIRKTDKLIYDRLQDIYMYQPTTMIYKEKKELLKILPTPTEEVILCLEDIFGDVGKEVKKYLNKSIIYFDQPIEELDIGLSRKNTLELLLKNLSQEEFGVKVHPRKNNFNYKDYKIDTIEASMLPWEVTCNGLKNTVLMTLCSGAVITPIFLYKNNNIVILLYRLLLNNTIEHPLVNKMDRFFSRVEKEYPNQVFIPNDEEELKNILEQVKR